MLGQTPYTDSNEKLENSSLSHSTDGFTFKTLSGVTKPIDSSVDVLNTEGHMRDADMLLKDGQIEIN